MPRTGRRFIKKEVTIKSVKKSKSKKAEFKPFILLTRKNNFFDIWHVNDIEYTWKQFEEFCRKFRLEHKFITRNQAVELKAKKATSHFETNIQHESKAPVENEKDIDSNMVFSWVRI